MAAIYRPIRLLGRDEYEPRLGPGNRKTYGARSHSQGDPGPSHRERTQPNLKPPGRGRLLRVGPWLVHLRFYIRSASEKKFSTFSSSSAAPG